MWLLEFLPNWVFHLIVLVGILGLLIAQFIKVIPFVTQYRLFIQIGSIIVLTFGLYMEGGISNQEKWEARVNKLKAEIIISESKSNEANIKLASAAKEKIKIVKDTQVIIQTRIKEVETKIDAECKISPDVITILNDAARKVK